VWDARLPLAHCLRHAARVRYLWVMTVPRHALPGRIVLTVGLVTSWFCVVGLIILWLGQGAKRRFTAVLANEVLTGMQKA